MNDEKPREYTEEEIRKMFIQHVWCMIDYWEHETQVTSTRRKLAGLAHSILATLDGSTPGLPAFIVAPIPHKDDKQYDKDEGSNWFPENDVSKVNCDIGPLHDYLYKYGHRD